MNYRQIEIFAAVVKSGTASRAAELLGITQPAVSRALAELERLLGFALFDRVRNRLVLTPEGKLFYRDVEVSFRGIDTLRASAARIRDQGAGEIRVASLSALGSALVPKAIAKFNRKHPKIRVTFHVMSSRDVRRCVVSGQFDIGLTSDEIDVAGVLHQTFVTARAMCALPLGHPLCDRAVITPADLDGVPLVGYVPEDRTRQRMELIFTDAGVVPQFIVETIYGASVCALVSEGVGIGLVTSYAIGGIDVSRLAFRPFEPPLFARSLLILPLDRPKSRLVRDFISCLLSSR
ncbi:MAG TPA: LysR substrate-binding domain-containing protein [Aliidongia sp.]|uniref:LysR substrate-binding domain-containing protein n=1 Tax=Aliidongia sp. TaxID=1914230 RepID=UPI002DDCE443|nr:LysR substrate-binding domain-containing protein [Aliidongia sp.]HEV2674723.1 LysR substrate-binding domain-containing protein [Aliidongia sp.]